LNDKPLNFSEYKYLIKGIIMLSEVCILDLNIGDLKPLENLLFEFKKSKIQSMAIQHSDVAATLKNYEKLLKIKRIRSRRA